MNEPDQVGAADDDAPVVPTGRPDRDAVSDTETPTREQALEQERDQYYDRLLRTSAEFDNYRRRVDRERREQADRTVTDVFLEMLPIIDDLERALKAEAAGEQAEAYRQGVELIYRQMVELLRRRGVTPFDALGQDFDPHLHQAVVSEEAPDRRDGEVIEQFRRGYMAGDRLLRPATVKVARA
ncbi:MAG: nucleotide exchange factor GrpE [Acidobacteria bacterium]|nr:nucleotide exchange factor GrpE [Acidobacteriota bacterium]